MPNYNTLKKVTDFNQMHMRHMWCPRVEKIFGQVFQKLCLVFTRDHFTTFCLFNAFSMSYFSPIKPLGFAIIVKNNMKIFSIYATFLWCNKPKSIDYGRYNFCVKMIIFNSWCKKNKPLWTESGPWKTSLKHFLPEHKTPLIEFSDWK